jgi:hypothetical protein
VVKDKCLNVRDLPIGEVMLELLVMLNTRGGSLNAGTEPQNDRMIPKLFNYQVLNSDGSPESNVRKAKSSSLEV